MTMMEQSVLVTLILAVIAFDNIPSLRLCLHLKESSED